MSEPTMPPPYTPPPMSPTGNTVSPNRTIMIVLSYLWLLALIPLLVEKDDKEVQWHAKHGLVLLVCEVILNIAFTILVMITHLACLGCFAHSAIYLGILIVHILCIVKGVNGQRFIIPGISDFANRF
jgi:uncharacterized membrane protein